MTAQLHYDSPTLHLAVEGAFASTRASLTPSERAEMFALLDRHFEGVTASQFERDLNDKDWVLRIRQDGALVGFTSLHLSRAQHDGRCVNVLYSGDTIVAPEAWGSPVLARGWIALVRALQQTRDDGPWYWLLLSSGFRTYRFLPVFWREFWPRHDAPTPAREHALMSELAHARYGRFVDAARGVVRFEHPQRLRPALAAVPEAKLTDPHVRFFLERNPSHASGDELICLTRLSDDNLTAAGARMVRAPRAANMRHESA